MGVFLSISNINSIINLDAVASYLKTDASSGQITRNGLMFA